MDKKIIFILAISLLISISTVSALESKLDFDNHLVYENQKDVNTEKGEIVEVDRSLFVRVTMTNPNDYWIKIDSLSWEIISYKNNENVDVITKANQYDKDTITKSETNILIPPQDIKEVYVILDAYNALDESKRIGAWEIDFEGQLDGISYLQRDNLKEIYPSSINKNDLIISKANLLEFTVAKEPEKNPQYGLFNKIPGFEDINPLIDALISVIALIGAILGIYKKIVK